MSANLMDTHASWMHRTSIAAARQLSHLHSICSHHGHLHAGHGAHAPQHHGSSRALHRLHSHSSATSFEDEDDGDMEPAPITWPGRKTRSSGGIIVKKAVAATSHFKRKSGRGTSQSSTIVSEDEPGEGDISGSTIEQFDEFTGVAGLGEGIDFIDQHGEGCLCD